MGWVLVQVLVHCGLGSGLGPGPGPVLTVVCPQVESSGEAEEVDVVAAGHLCVRPLHRQTVSVHPGQTRLPQLR